MKRVTIKDIAKELNLHHSTVSRALRDEKSINPRTREKVLSYARERGYQVNRSALQLRGNKNNVIGVVVPNINHSFFSNYVSLVADLAFKQGYVVSVFQSNESLGQEKEIIKALIQQNVSGVMASVSMETSNASHFSILQDFHIPLILFDRVDFSLPVPKVVLNNFEILQNTVKLFASRGYDRIAYLSGPPVSNVFADRQKGYYTGIEQAGYSYRNCKIIGNFTLENSQEALNLLFSDDLPDALICDSHIFMLGAIMKAQKLGMKIPGDFGIAGFGSFTGMPLISSGLIMLKQPEEEMAGAAFRLLIEAIEGKSKIERDELIICKASIFETKNEGKLNTII